jgi:pimeloyl-ACP methyl ester carboxylesterase
MTKCLSFLTLMAILAVLLGACAASEESLNVAASLPLYDCRLDGRIDALCGKLTVPENRADPNGPQIELNLAVVAARSRNPAPDPLFFLSGGPGQAATESYPLLSGAFDSIHQKRDIVLVDQRGTGKSNPLDCPQVKEDSDEEADEIEFTRQCAAALKGDPRFYTTEIAMQDVEDVRRALGYWQINLYGVSYGSRAALTYLRLFPAQVRSLILDGVVPPDEPLGLYVAADAQRALDLIFQRCQGVSACQEAFPDLAQSFDQLLNSLRDSPGDVSLPDPTSGEIITMTFTAEKMGSAVRLLSYTPETVALLPLLIDAAARNQDYDRLAAQYLIVAGDLNESVSRGLNLSVLCAEDQPYIDPQVAEAANQGTYLGNAQTSDLAKICAVWPHGEPGKGFNLPVQSDVPALLLSGEADPVTPPSNAERVAQGLSDSLQLVVPGGGHNVIYRGCIPRLAAEFIDAGSPQGLDASCVEQIEPLPFFLNFSGPVLSP